MISFYDVKSERYDTPVFVTDEVMAKRHFMLSIQKKGSMLNTFKNDFEMHEIASFDVIKGEVNSLGKVKVIMRGKDIADASNRPDSESD